MTKKAACGKTAYKNKSHAMSAALRNSTRFGKTFRAYFDDECEHWHLSTKPLRRSRETDGQRV